MNAVGIDLGTTNSAISIMKGRPVIVEVEMGNRTVPSAVGWDPDVEELIIGRDAKENTLLYQTVLSVKRRMGTDERSQVGPHQWLPEEVSAQILRFLKQQVEDKCGEPVTEAIITVPAHFQMAQIAATKRAGELAGLEVQQCLAEPSAAVMAYGPQDDEKILVYDLGGGTFDVAIIDYFSGILSTLAVFGNNYLGGDDFDNRLMRHFCELIEKEQGIKLELQTDRDAADKLKKAAEKAKIDLSRRPAARVEIAKVLEVNNRPVGLETVIKRDFFESMIRDLVDATLVEVEKALNHAKLDKADISTILLVGGSTYIPLVQESVKTFFGKDPNKEINPDLAVSLGAAASLLVDKLPEDGRLAVTVSWIPEETPSEEIEVEGRTAPNAEVRIEGGAKPVVAVADESGYYLADVALNMGMNQLKVTAATKDGKKATIEPEPVVRDLKAIQLDAPPASPRTRLSRALTISCNVRIGPGRVVHQAVGDVIPAQSELPISVRKDDFATAYDNQRQLLGDLLEGDLPLADLNGKLAQIELELPPNVPEGEQVRVNYHVDESFELTATLECVGRTQRVKVNLKSPLEHDHIFAQVEKLLTKVGDRLQPQEREALEQNRRAIEDLAAQIRRFAEANDSSEAHWQAYERLEQQSNKLRGLMDQIRDSYATELSFGGSGMRLSAGGLK